MSGGKRPGQTDESAFRTPTDKADEGWFSSVAIRRRGQERERNLRMVKNMGGLADNREMTMMVRRRSHGTFRGGPILARQIRRDDRVGDPTVDMIGFTVMMVGLRMNMNQRHSQHPGRQPRHKNCTSPGHTGKHVRHIFLHINLVTTVAQNA